jgi:large subunit ribosomal protein L21
MKYAIVESGGKQYKAVEGESIDVDRLPANVGENVELKQVLMIVDGEDVNIGAPTVSGIQVGTTVVSHFKGPKIIIFKYSPKKRIRVKTGHRQQYTRLNVDVIGKPGESRKTTKVAKAEPLPEKPVAKVEKKEVTSKVVKEPPVTKKASTSKPAKAAPKKIEAAKKTTKAPAAKPAKPKTSAKSPVKKTTTKAPAKAPAKKPSTSKSTKSTKSTK